MSVHLVKIKQPKIAFPLYLAFIISAVKLVNRTGQAIRSFCSAWIINKVILLQPVSGFVFGPRHVSVDKPARLTSRYPIGSCQFIIDDSLGDIFVSFVQQGNIICVKIAIKVQLSLSHSSFLFKSLLLLSQ